MISGVDDPELGKAALEHGAYAYMVKPVGATQLYLTVVNNLQAPQPGARAPSNAARGWRRCSTSEPDQMRRAVELQAGMLPASPLEGRRV